MAAIYADSKTGIYRIHFWYGAKQFHRSLDTTQEKKANSMKTLHDMERGRRSVPADADFWQFILSDGKLEKKPVVQRAMTLGELFASYFQSLLENAKEPKTLKTEHVHERHFLHVLGARKPLSTITGSDLQEYVNQRARARYHGKPIRTETIDKEIKTLQMVWNRAVEQGKISYAFPGRKLDYPKKKEKPAFQTWEEIERTIARDGLTDDEKRMLWDCLFLDRTQIEELLELVRNKKTRSAYFFPLIAFAAHTGARLAEIMRSRLEDFDFEHRRVVIREKKRDRTKEMTFRRVRMSEYLCQVMQDYFKTAHPGGVYTICREANEPMLESTLHEAFDWFFHRSKWKVLRGYHALRHSFASNLARQGVPDRVIDKLMGHQTEAMRRRYQHLFPEEMENAIKKLYG